MVDGVILLVDAAEGPMPQTKFVTGKALSLGLKPIVVVNKIDRPDARPAEVLDEVFELFLNLEANDEQLDFPTLYASGRAGYAGTTDDVRSGDLTPLFETIVSHVPRPRVDAGPFRMLATLLDRDPFLGRILTGRIESGKLTTNMPIKALDVNGNLVEEGRATKVFAFRGLERVPVESAEAGEIVAIAGLIKATVSNTFADPSVQAPLHARPIDPPTLAMSFAVNDSPFAGRDKTRLTFGAPSRGLIGYHGEFLSDTRGTGIMNRLFERYGPYKGPIAGRQNGVLISMEQGPAVAYALSALEDRGVLFISPGEMLYEGMVIGENAKPQDLEVNPLKSKQLTNFRASGPKDEGIRLTPPRRMTLEQAIAYIQDDELVEVTPKVVRIRKRWLDPHERKKASRRAEAA